MRSDNHLKISNNTNKCLLINKALLVVLINFSISLEQGVKIIKIRLKNYLLHKKVDLIIQEVIHNSSIM